jgi:hypothetical protein
VFGLGAILYELLTGRPPYAADTPHSVLRQAEACQLVTPRQHRPSIPRGLERLCLRAMSAAPERRHASAAEFEHALRRWRRSPQRLAIGGGMLVVSLALLGAGYHGLRGKAVPAEPAATSPMAVVPVGAVVPAAPLRIVHLDVEHLAKSGEQSFEPRGNLGEASFEVKPGDDVRLRAELSAPAFAFLIALRPDGVVEVCDPDDAAVPPAPTKEPRYPPRSKTTEVYRLEDGTGLQAFALVVSKDPLPSFQEWWRKAGAPPWQAGLPSPAGVVWRHDGQWLILGSRSNPGGQRGKGKSIRGGAPVAVLADWLRAIPGVDAVAVVAFPVPPVVP